MADLSNLGLDENVKEQGVFEILPAGKYQMVIIEHDVVDTKDKKGKRFVMKLQVISGEQKGVEIEDGLNIINPSLDKNGVKSCQNIGQGHLKTICKLCNVPYPPKNTLLLNGKPMTVTVEVKQFESNTTGKMLDSNNVKGYSKAQKKTAAPANDTAPAVNVGDWNL